MNELKLMLLGQHVIYVIEALLIVWIAKKFADWRTKDIDDDFEVEENSNLAIGVRRSGLYLGGMIAMFGVLTGETRSFAVDVRDIAIYGALAFILLFIARWVSDAWILRGIDNDEECKECATKPANTAVGLVEFGNYIGVGLVINGVISGDGSVDLWQGIFSTLIFFAIAQLIMVVLIKLYDFITPFDWKDEIRGGNTSAAIMTIGKCVAIGLILRAAVAGPDHALGEDIISFLVSAGIGILLLFSLNLMINKMFLPHVKISDEVGRDRNNAAAIIIASVTIGFSLLLTMVI